MTDGVDLFVEKVVFNGQGLVPVIAQDASSKDVLMMAWMNEEALRKTLTSGDMWYWSRSRQSLWRKGESSGQTQKLLQMIADCDGDTLLAMVVQLGAACHTGRKNCFFTLCRNDAEPETLHAPLIRPEDLYGRS